MPWHAARHFGGFFYQPARACSTTYPHPWCIALISTLLLASPTAEAELAKRAELERKLVELSDREYDLMVELRRLMQEEA